MQAATVRVDPITLELVHEGLIAVVREMRANVLRTAYSSIIYESQDFSCVILDEEGQLVAKAPVDNPVHILPVPWSVRAIVDRFDGDLHPGDIFLHNDPYTGGTHLNDVATICPVFVDERLFAFAVVRQHWGDIGGMTPGSISGQAMEIYQEGLRIPPIRAYDEGRPNQAALDLIFANVRGPRQRRGDFTAALISCHQAARKLETMARRYGSATLRTCMARLMERAEARMRRCLAGTPPGVYSYEAYAETTGRALEPVLARLKITVGGGELRADFSGSSPQGEGPMNVGPAMAPAAVLVITKSYLDRTADVNQGAWRPLHTHVPEGTFLNARLPAACGGMMDARYVADTAMMGALAAAIPEAATGDNKGAANHIYIAALDARGEHTIFYEYPAGGTAAWSGGDGNNTMRHFQEGDFTSIQPVEAVENEHPLLIERCEIRSDSAGGGCWRGGFGLRRDVRVMTDQAILSVLSERNIITPHGVCGGESGAGNRFTVQREGREVEPSRLPGKVSGFPLRRDDIVIMRTAGGGGYGDPLDRPPDLVWRDVAQGYLTPGAARARYGVTVTGSGIDEVATAALRAELRGRRVFVRLAPWGGPEFLRSRRILPLAQDAARRAGIAEDDVVELVHPRGAPLRCWVRLRSEDGDRAYLGPLGLEVLRARPGDRFWLRRLTAWAPPQPEEERSATGTSVFGRSGPRQHSKAT